MRILYVEDHAANLFLVQRIARIGNHQIINHTDGQEALDHFEADKPDMVLMDVQLPGKLTGLEVVKALRAAGHKLPIIAVTAYAMMGDKERCLEAGCDSYMAKPMSVSELVEVMKRYDPANNPKPAESHIALTTESKAVTVEPSVSNPTRQPVSVPSLPSVAASPEPPKKFEVP